MALTQNIHIFRGEDVQLIFTMTPTTNVSGWTTRFTVKKAYNSPTELLHTSGIVTDGAGGEFTVNLPRASTNVATGAYVYDFVRTDTNDYTVLSTGVFKIEPGVYTPVV